MLNSNHDVQFDLGSIDATGTLTCTGAICDKLGQTPGVPFDLSLAYFLGGSTPTPSAPFGVWHFNADLSQLNGSADIVEAVFSDVSPFGPAGTEQYFADLRGAQVPEPGTAALILLGLVALAPRARKA